MSLFRRTDTSLIGHWWWTVDRWLLVALALLLALGFVMTVTASVPEAERMGLGSFYFAKRQGVFILLGLTLMLAVSLASRDQVKGLALIGFGVAYGLVVLTLFVGPERNGATRWLSLGGFSLQPSELLKPCFIVLSAWLLAGRFAGQGDAGMRWSLLLTALVIAALALQPDIGQASLLAVVWITQLFLAGLPLVWMLGLLGAGIMALASAYLTMPYVAQRIHAFIDPGPAAATPTQMSMALDAFRYGGLFGRGPSEGEVKLHLPDAYADYIFSVMGEEFGLAACVTLVSLFLVVVLRGLARLLDEEDPFALLAVAGLLVQLGLQAFINMGVNVGLLPPKGMTLPFVSYGGSSMLGVCLAMGFLLALTRRRRFGRAPLILPARYRA
ncbi:MAG: cell division protein FtsW [Alphaproteobacteria bacterium]|nr:MAG: cell division protein FtsW [Alphaproteobacteria bacterium]